MSPAIRSAPNWASASWCSASINACCGACSERVPCGSQISRGKAAALAPLDRQFVLVHDDRLLAWDHRARRHSFHPRDGSTSAQRAKQALHGRDVFRLIRGNG